MLVQANNSRGNIAIAIVVALVAVMSGVSLTSVAFRDTNSFRQQIDAIQQFHFIRSEVGRGRFVASHFDSAENPPQQSVLPIRSMNVDFGSHRTLYRAKTKLEAYSDIYDTGYSVLTLISAIRGGQETSSPDLQSAIKKYSEYKMRSLQTLAIFHYFSDIDEERDGVPGNIRFFSGDVVYGRVHSNTDIWILANSWPTFHGLVSTGGTIKVHPGGGANYPRDQIFRGGLIEHYRRIAFEPSAELVRNYGSWPLGRSFHDDKIAYVTVDGASYEIQVMSIIEETNPPYGGWIEGYNQFTIYDSYPPYGPVVGESLAVNRIPRKDTVVTEVTGGSLSNTSAFIPMEMWISGTFGGRQTWASSHDIYLKDDLLYERTIPGHRPDGIDDSGNRTRPVNPTDYLGMISEKSIWIQYGHFHPVDSVRVRPNTNNIMMYGAYCAVGKGQQIWDDGIFSFQYQFPKGSTPSQYYMGEWFYKIDLHRFRYPTTPMYPWLPGLDYPWYNPLWPEPGTAYNHPPIPNPHNAPSIVKLRGDINLFGSVAQRRRGYVRRSGNRDFDTGIWDIENVIEPNGPPRYGSPDPPIGPTGYNKRYSFDTRFERIGPPHFPLVKFEGYDSDDLMDLGHLTVSWIFKRPPSNF